MNFRIYGSRTRGKAQQRISPGFGGEKASSEESAEKIACRQSSPPPEEAIAEAKEGEETADEEEAVEGEKLAKSPLEQTRPLPFVDETAEEEE